MCGTLQNIQTGRIPGGSVQIPEYGTEFLYYRGWTGDGTCTGCAGRGSRRGAAGRDESDPVKATNDVGSQVIVNGEVLKNMSAREYFAYKKQLIPDIMKAFHKLEEENDIIVIEGAGSPAEINLKKDDIVNMGLAKMVDAPVLLVGDIDRGGVFAQLLGTLMLLEDDEKERVKGLVINKFRGDKTILDPGIVMLEERGGIPVVGVTPYMQVEIEDEDSLTERFNMTKGGKGAEERIGLVDIAVIRTPRISNLRISCCWKMLRE